MTTTLAGRRVTKLRLHYPASGQWLAHVTLESGAVPSAGSATLTIADLSLPGSILPGRVGDDSGAVETVVKGGAGWDTLLTRAGTYAGGSVRLSTVLKDLAALAGEPYDAPTERILAEGYTWEASTSYAPVRARDVLDDLVVRGAIPTWRVHTNGRTRFDAWPSLGAVDTYARITDRDLQRGIRYLGLDTIASRILPGATIEGVAIDRVVLLEDTGALTAEAWSTAAPPARASLRKLVTSLFPWLARIRLDTDGNLSIQAATTKIKMAGGDAAIGRVGDFVARFYRDTVTSTLYVSASSSAPYAWVPVASGIIAPTIADAGTEVLIRTGSEKVSSG